MSGPCGGVVSIQQDGAGNALERHLSFGVLVDDDAVVVPGPLDWLRDVDVTFEVLIASQRNGGPGAVERIRVRAAEIIGLEDHPEGSIGVLRLAYPSRHRPVAEPLDLEAATAALAEQADVWTVLEETGGLPRGIRDLPTEAVLGPVVEWERRRREQLVTVRPAAPAQTVEFICCWFVACKKCLLCAGDWW